MLYLIYIYLYINCNDNFIPVNFIFFYNTLSSEEAFIVFLSFNYFLW